MGELMLGGGAPDALPDQRRSVRRRGRWPRAGLGRLVTDRGRIRAASPDLAVETRSLSAGDAWKEDGWAFTNPEGAALSTSVVDQTFVRVRRRASVRPLPLSSLRHAAASILLGARVPVAVAAKMMGHSGCSLASRCVACCQGWQRGGENPSNQA